MLVPAAFREALTKVCRAAEWRTNVCGGTASGDAVPGGVWHRPVAQRNSTVQSEQPSPINGCGTPVAAAPPRTVSRLQSCVVTDWEILLRPAWVRGATRW